MALNYTLNINDLETKHAIKELLTGENTDEFYPSITFRSMDFIDDDRAMVTVHVDVHRIFQVSPLLKFSAYIAETTKKEARFSFNFDPGMAPNEIIKSLWPFFIAEFDTERTWLDYAKPGTRGAVLLIQCGSELAFTKLSEKKAFQQIKRKIREYTGCDIEVVLEKKEDEPGDKKPSDAIRTVEIAKPKVPPSKILKDEDIPGEVTHIENILGKGKYILEGRIFVGDEKNYWRDMKGREGGDAKIIFFYLTDEKETIKLSCWCDENDGLIGAVKDIGYARVLVEADYYPNEVEVTGRVKKMKITAAPEVMDTAKEKRVELHAHTQMSAMDAMTDIKEYIRTAARWGHPAVAITDHGVVHAYPLAYNAVSDKRKPIPIKLILGMEGYLMEKTIRIDRNDKDGVKYDEKPFHIILLVKNQAGLRNMYKLVTLSHLDHFYKKPNIPREKLTENREGLIIGTACYLGELFQAILNRKSDEEIRSIASFYDYFEIQPDENNRFLVKNGRVASFDELHAINARICALGEELGKPVVATGDVHFLKPEDKIYREVIMSGQGYDDIGDSGTADLSFRTTDNMLAEFMYLGSEKAYEVVVTNTRLVADMVEPNIRPVPKDLNPPTIDNSDEEIRGATWNRAAEIYGTNLPEVVSERVDRELKAIIGNKYSVLYLIAKKMVEKSNSDGYIVGSRGSVGSSMVAFLCGISEVNPLQPHYVCGKCQHSEFVNSDLAGVDMPDKECPVCGEKLIKDGFNIPFETFMGFKGEKVPDIDLNFSGEYQEKIHKFIVELFGSDKVFRAGTIGTVQEKTVKREYIPKYEERTKKKVKEAEKERLSKGCSGVKRSTGQHAGGLMLVPRDRDIYDFTPVQNPPNDYDTITTHFDYEYIHDALVKIDALGHDLPTSLKRICGDLKINVNDIPIDDKDTMKLFSGVSVLKVDPKNYTPAIGTLGVPEYGTRFTREMLAMTKPKTFSELVYIAGLSHGTDVWRGNAEELIKNKTATLKEVISVRDDIMNFLISKGMPKDVSFQITESVRKGKGLTTEWEDGMKKHKVPDWYIASCKKIQYMFPKAHAVAYAIMAFRIAYMKVHQPLYFYADYFNRDKAGFDYEFAFMDSKKLGHTRRELEMKMREKRDKKANAKKEEDQIGVVEVLLEMKERGFDFLNIDIYQSDPHIFTVRDGKILIPLTVVPSLGETVADALAKERVKEKFKSMEDMVKRTKINKNVVEFLTINGISGDIPASDQTVLF
jgi:DNA polymerase-3 subunit alpha (Gram-positive type)